MRASLRAEYQITDLRSESLRNLADLVGWLPPGCALWRSFGGEMSLSIEMHELRAIEYRLRLLAWMQSKDGSAGRNQPKPPKVPPRARERRAEDDLIQRKAAAYRRRNS